MEPTDVVLWITNVITSVGIVMVNKQLMAVSGYGFSFATCLCGLHFLTTSCTTFFFLSRNSSDIATSRISGVMSVPTTDVFKFVAVSVVSIVSLNMSLMLNTVGFYQICKLAQIPTMCLIESIFLHRKISFEVMLSIGLVLVGVGFATVSDVEISASGTVASILGVFSTSSQQILVAFLQEKNKVTSTFLLAETSPYMATSMLLAGPFLDHVVTGNWVFDYEWDYPAGAFLIISCVTAVLVNVSSFYCIGRFSAVSFQVIGHVKTCLVFVFGFICFTAPITRRNYVGCTIAMIGIIHYSFIKGKTTIANPIPIPDLVPVNESAGDSPGHDGRTSGSK